MSADLAADVRRLVLGAAAASDHERAARADFATFFPDEHGPVSRDDGPDHATASALVFDQTLTRTLLVFHTKGQFWVQPGGHLETVDASIADAALRELREETGVVVSGLAESLVYDLDHHGLSSAFGRCSSHLDIGVAVVVSEDAALVVSDESEDVRWWPIDALPAQVPQGFEERVRLLRDRVAG
ncbi:NUDIX domain-containing protein [Microbacterium sp. WCS2018Hpa-23]|uniref:NUDIX hydrolase n=1 Tax=Microbacterium sp. WCS2018Hpa-23 TaxID=3073634 RepID=UPI0028833B76|nr:NUDIX domain-containing protein [Microbacterium sp. WCS2018Hpa-23]